MNQVGKMQAAGPEDLVDEQYIREDQGPSCYEYQWHQEIENGKIGDFLQRVEFTPAVYGERRLFPAEDSKQVIPGLHGDFLDEPAPSHPVIHTVFGKHIAKEDNQVIDSQKDTGNVVPGYGFVEAYNSIIRT